MDRHLFRGRRVDNAGWVVGHCIGTTKSGNVYLHASCDEYEPMLGATAGIDPTTLGQCMGGKDKNGDLIYEDDIVQEDNNYYPNRGFFTYYLIVWDDRGFAKKYLYDEKGKNELSGKILRLYGWCGGKHTKVIGNIHDNPELLKGASQ